MKGTLNCVLVLGSEVAKGKSNCVLGLRWGLAKAALNCTLMLGCEVAKGALNKNVSAALTTDERSIKLCIDAGRWCGDW